MCLSSCTEKAVDKCSFLSISSTIARLLQVTGPKAIHCPCSYLCNERRFELGAGESQREAGGRVQVQTGEEHFQLGGATVPSLSISSPAFLSPDVRREAAGGHGLDHAHLRCTVHLRRSQWLSLHLLPVSAASGQKHRGGEGGALLCSSACVWWARLRLQACVSP